MIHHLIPICLSIWSLVILLSPVGTVHGQNDQTSELEMLRAELKSMRADVADLRRQQDENWMNERRAEEIKGLIHEVLADAETRATLVRDSIYAGDQGGKFFLASGDGSFRMEFGGQLQMRYVVNVNNGSASASDDSGFQFRRVKFKAKGHAHDNFIYQVSLQGDTDSATDGFDMDESYLGYKLDGQWKGTKIRGGYMKLPFMFEELTSSSRQLTVERSSFNEFFTADKAIGAELAYKQESYIARLMLSNQPGSDFVNGDFTGADGHFAGAGRVDIKLLGNWKQAKDFNAWSGKDPFLQIGGAIAWADTTDDFTRTVAYTTDALYKTGQLSLYGAAAFADVDDPTALGSALVGENPWGVMVQGAYFIVPDHWQPFLRYEYIDGDTAADSFDLMTAGINYYFKKHRAKFTLDMVVALSDTISAPGDAGIWGQERPFGTGLGMNGYTGNEMMTFRAQFQMLF